jgi:hypothetical protein
MWLLLVVRQSGFHDDVLLGGSMGLLFLEKMMESAEDILCPLVKLEMRIYEGSQL